MRALFWAALRVPRTRQWWRTSASASRPWASGGAASWSIGWTACWTRRGRGPRARSPMRRSSRGGRTLERRPRRDALEHPLDGAAPAGQPQTAVTRIWRAFGLQPHRSETFKLSTDPLFVEKVRDIVGLYMSPRPARWCCASTRRARSRRSIGPSRSCRCARARPSGALTTTTATARRRCSPRWTSKPAR